MSGWPYLYSSYAPDCTVSLIHRRRNQHFPWANTRCCPRPTYSLDSHRLLAQIPESKPLHPKSPLGLPRARLATRHRPFWEKQTDETPPPLHQSVLSQGGFSAARPPIRDSLTYYRSSISVLTKLYVSRNVSLARIKKSVSEPMKKVVIIGAAGRDFHNFNIIYRNDPEYQVVAFTATQIPGIEGRTNPPIISGSRYQKGIPIYAERELARIIQEK